MDLEEWVLKSITFEHHQKYFKRKEARSEVLPLCRNSYYLVIFMSKLKEKLPGKMSSEASSV